MKRYIDRFSKDEGIVFTKYVGNVISNLNQHKLEQLAKYFNTTTDAVIDKLIDTAYLQLPKDTNKIKRLNVPVYVLTLKELITYLNTTYNNHNELVFNLQSYNSIADSMVNLKIYPGNLRDYLKYNYPKTKVTIKD